MGITNLGISAPAMTGLGLPSAAATGFYFDAAAGAFQNDLFSVGEQSAWISYDSAQGLSRLAGLRFGESALAKIEAEGVSAQPTSGVALDGHVPVESILVPAISSGVAAIIAFALGVWIGRRSMKGKQPALEQFSQTRVQRGEAVTLPEVDDVAVTLRTIDIVGVVEQKAAPEARLHLSNIDTSKLSDAEYAFLYAWKSYAGIYRANDIGPSLRPQLAYIIMQAVRGYYDKFKRQGGQHTAAFFDYLHELAKQHAAMEDRNSDTNMEAVDARALFAVMLTEPAVVADKRLDRVVVKLARSDSVVPIVEKAFVEGGDELRLRSSAASVDGFAEAMARLSQNSGIFAGELGGAFLLNVAHAVACLADTSPDEARKARFSLLINSVTLEYGHRKDIRRTIMPTFKQETDAEWLSEIAAGRWPVKDRQDAVAQARMILDRF